MRFTLRSLIPLEIFYKSKKKSFISSQTFLSNIFSFLLWNGAFAPLLCSAPPPSWWTDSGMFPHCSVTPSGRCFLLAASSGCSGSGSFCASLAPLPTWRHRSTSCPRLSLDYWDSWMISSWSCCCSSTFPSCTGKWWRRDSMVRQRPPPCCQPTLVS